MPNDRLKFLLSKEKVVSGYIDDRIATYHDSRVYKSLRDRIEKLGDMIDMRYSTAKTGWQTKNSWRSNISMPLVRESYLMTRAMITANFRNDPILTAVPTGESTADQAEKAQMALEGSMRESRFREWALRDMIEWVSRAGIAVVVPRFMRQETNSYVTQPQRMLGQTVGTERVPLRRRKNFVRNWVIDPQNYFQDPQISNPYDSPYQGYIDRVTLAQVIADVKQHPGRYIRQNVVKVIEECKKAQGKDDRFVSRNGGEWDWVGVDVRYWYGRLNIEGNEEDDTDYYVEKAGETILRVEENPWDYGIRPPTVLTIDKRPDKWHGNTPPENSVPMENYLGLVLAMSADQGLRELQNYVFYNRAMGIDVADINNRAQNGGWVPMDIKPDQRPQDMFYMFAPNAGNLQNFQWIISEVKEGNQRLQPKPDLQRKANQGGMQNSTATAALQLQEEGDIQQNFYLWQFGDCLRELGHKNLVMLQQLLPEQFMARRSPTESPQMIEKAEMLGEFGLDIHSTLTKNKQIQLLNLFNVLTAINNFKGSGAPTYQAIQDGRVVRKWLQTALPDEDIDQIFPKEAMNAPPVPPQIGNMLGAQQGMPGQPKPGPGGAPAAPPPAMPTPAQGAMNAAPA